MNSLLKVAATLVVALICVSFTQAQDCSSAETITGNIVADRTIGAGCTFIDGYVFVEPGVTLTIEAGAVIKGIESPTTGDGASALIVARGAMIMAEGTEDDPIIFTAESDDVDVLDDKDVCEQMLWGGVILLGSAPLNSSANLEGQTPIVDLIEGIPNDEDFAEYGGTDAADNSGVLRYISIRHGGNTLDADNEINGLTLGGVGSGTTIEFIEIFANSDDGIEWFGGTVDIKFAVVTNVGDDSFDYDQGADFNVQFGISIGSDDCDSNRGAEQDGSVEAPTATPFATPAFSNVTYIGKGPFQADTENEIALFRDAAGGFYQNSVFCNSPRGILVEDDFPTGGPVFDACDQFSFGNLAVRFSTWGAGLLSSSTIALSATGNGPGAGDPSALISTSICNRNLQDFLNNPANNNAFDAVACPNYTLSTQVQDGFTLNIVEVNGTDPGPAQFGGQFPAGAGDFFTPVDYRGAFDSDPSNFWANWTHTVERGILIP